MNTSLEMIGFWLVDFGAIVTILLGAALALRLLLRDSRSRVLLAWGTWLGVALAAMVTCLPIWPRYEATRLMNWRRNATSLAVANQPSQTPLVVALGPSDLGPPSAPYETANEMLPPWRWSQLLAIAWLAAALSAAAWIGIGLWQIQRLLWQSMTAPPWIVDELTRIAANDKPAADVRISKRLPSAVALGAIRSVILLPAESATTANLKAIRAALAHEWAHIQHGDLWLLALERLVMPLLAAHPLYWWLRRSTRLDQELLADAAAAGNQPIEYAEALVAWAKTAAPAQAGLAALAMSECPSNLSRRVKMILNPKRQTASRFSTFCGLAAAACLLVLIGALSLITFRPMPAEDGVAARVLSNPPLEPTQSEPQANPDASDSLFGAVFTQKATTPLEETELGRETNEPLITLKVTLLSRDFDRVSYEAIKVMTKLDRINYRGQGTERTTLKAELDESSAETVLSKLQALEGVRTLCKSSIIALSGQRAVIEVSEPGPRVEVEEGRGARVYSNPKQDILHRVAITTRTTTDPNLLEVTVYGGWLKLPVVVGKTLMLVNTSENDILFISPTKVERPAVTMTARVPSAEVRADPASPKRPEQPLPAAVSDGRRSATVFHVRENATAVAERLRKRLDESKIADAQVNVDERTNAIIVMSKWDDRAGIQRLVVELDVPANAVSTGSSLTQKKLLELDLADAQLNLKEAQAELNLAKELAAKDKGAVSHQELQKHEFHVERAKIQVQRIQVQLEAAGLASEPPAAAPAAPSRSRAPRQR